MPPPNRPPPKRKWSSKYSDNDGNGDGEYEAAMRAAKMRRGDDDDDDEDRPILLGSAEEDEEDERDRAARRRYFADSAWKFSAFDRIDDVEYEHVGDGSALRLPETESLMRKSVMDKDGGGNVEVGRWGEELVYKYLLSRLKKPDSGIVQVSWGNKFDESGMPYDIVVRKVGSYRLPDDPIRSSCYLLYFRCQTW